MARGRPNASEPLKPAGLQGAEGETVVSRSPFVKVKIGIR